MSIAVATPTFTLQTRGLNLWYGDFQALKDVEIAVKPGIITALIGPSGCGKSTLLRCFTRINERYGNVRTTGEITILGKNIYAPDVSLSTLRKTVGMVFQRPNPLPISIRDNVLFGVRSHIRRGEFNRRQLDEMVESALRDVQLWDEVKDRLRRRATHLTLEQQQKLCIARLLPLKPQVILMDEPCSALDAEGIERIEELIDELREKFTILMVTHNMAQARRASHECIFMLMGRIVEHGPTLDIFLNPREADTAMYVSGHYGERQLGLDPAAAEHSVAVVANRRLAGRDAVTRLIEHDAKAVVAQQFNLGVLRTAAIADFYLNMSLLANGPGSNQPVRPRGRQLAPGKFLARAKHHAPRVGLDANHITRLAECQTQSLALADGVPLDALVPPQRRAIGRDELA